MALLFLLFAILFLYAEVALVIAAGERIGALGVLAAFAGAALFGLYLMRRQGLEAYRKLHRAFAAGADPVEEISNRFLLLLAGLLLIVPGFLTDAFGLLLLLPFVRRGLIRGGTVGRARVFYSFSYPSRRSAGPAVIEGDYAEKNEPERQRGRPRLPGKGSA